MGYRQPDRHFQPSPTAPMEVASDGASGPDPGVPTADAPPDREQTLVLEEFVRFCRRRRRVGWPELYDEMCAVAARTTFRGWGLVELGERGIGFTLSDMPRLAAVVEQVVRAERTAERAGASGVGPVAEGDGAEGPGAPRARVDRAASLELRAAS
jgi:hypothetical protein